MFISGWPERRNLAQTSEWDKGGVAWQFAKPINQTWQNNFKIENMCLGPGGLSWGILAYGNATFIAHDIASVCCAKGIYFIKHILYNILNTLNNVFMFC